MRIAFFTLGCKVNQYESSALASRFAAEGFDIVEDGESADIYVINSCTVTAESDRKCRQTLRRFRRLNPAAIICLTGCFPQAFPAEAEKLAEADIILGTGGRGKLPEAIKSRLVSGERIIDITPLEKGREFEPMRVSDFQARTRAFVKIEDGCERFCTYCIIPHARGPVRSKSPADLRDELQNLAEKGYREVVLVGINLSSYGKEMGLRLLDAVQLACAIDGIERVRLGSLEPELLTDSDIEAMSKLPKLCPQFHLSLQSGCDSTLKRMNRHYDAREYHRIVGNIREYFQNSAITTDIMVGFPGESESEFAASLEFVKQVGFARSHVFAYSQRPGTAAATMTEQIPNAEKSRRSHEMAALTEASRLDFLRSQIGSKAQVLFETRLPDGRWEGYSENYTLVRAASLDNLAGQICAVHLLDVETDGCSGIIV